MVDLGSQRDRWADPVSGAEAQPARARARLHLKHYLSVAGEVFQHGLEISDQRLAAFPRVDLEDDRLACRRPARSSLRGELRRRLARGGDLVRRRLELLDFLQDKLRLVALLVVD